MEDLKFEYEGTAYNVPCMPRKEWHEWMTDKEAYCNLPPGYRYNNRCDVSECRECIYALTHRAHSSEARKSFYYKCFPEELRKESEEKHCEECANYEPKKERPKLTEEVFNREDCPSWVRYATVDEDGECFGWDTLPRLGFGSWTYPKGSVLRQQIYAIPGAMERENTLCDASDWRHSLVIKSGTVGYMLIRDTDLASFRAKVLQLLGKGWKLEGGATKDGDHYMQTLTKAKK